MAFLTFMRSNKHLNFHETRAHVRLATRAPPISTSQKTFQLPPLYQPPTLHHSKESLRVSFKVLSPSNVLPLALLPIDQLDCKFAAFICHVINVVHFVISKMYILGYFRPGILKANGDFLNILHIAQTCRTGK